MLFLGYPKCSTSNKAKAWLLKNDVVFQERDIKANNPSVDELRAWYELSQLDIKRFFNTSGRLYRAQGIKEVFKTATIQELLTILSVDGMMVKRPILVGEDFVLVGFNESKWTEQLLK